MSSIFSQRLIQLRKEKRLTQEGLGNILSIGRSTISGYETEGKEPDFDALCHLSDFFNVSADYLLGRTDTRGDEIIFRDSINIKKLYEELPTDLKIVVAHIYDDFYILLSGSIENKDSAALKVFEKLFKAIRENYVQLKELVSADRDLDVYRMTEIMSAQSNLKNQTTAVLDELIQTDLETAAKIKRNGSEPSEEQAM